MGFNMAIEGSGSDGDESGSPFSDTDSVDEDYDDATEFDSSPSSSMYPTAVYIYYSPPSSMYPTAVYSSTHYSLPPRYI